MTSSVYLYVALTSLHSVIQILGEHERIGAEYNHKMKSGLFHFTRRKRSDDGKAKFGWVIIVCDNAETKLKHRL